MIREITPEAAVPLTEHLRAEIGKPSQAGQLQARRHFRLKQRDSVENFIHQPSSKSNADDNGTDLELWASLLTIRPHFGTGSQHKRRSETA